MKLIFKVAIVGWVILIISCTNSYNEKAYADTAEQDTTALYQCPMQCEGQKSYKQSGPCPVCKMDLKLVHGTMDDSLVTTAVPPKSPRRSVIAEIGNNHVHLEYGSPSVRERVIWNGVVGYGQVWVSGAHSATSIEFSEDININQQKIEKGKYGFFTIPDNEEWTVILNKDWNMHLADNYLPDNDVIRIKVNPEKSQTLTEALTYEILPMGNGKGQIQLKWEFLAIKIEFENDY